MLEITRRNIRQLMHQAIERDIVDEIKALDALRLYGCKDLDHYIGYASKKNCKLAWLWLCMRKKEQYGFQDKEFRL